MENIIDVEAQKEEFVSLYRRFIQREGSDKLLDYLLSPKSDFFISPASTKYHLSVKGGLCRHSLNVYACLKNYLARPDIQACGLHFDDQTVATVALLHDICKVNCYKESKRNVKENGQWVEKAYFEFDDQMPYGHGEKSVYIINSFLRDLSREEAFAIRYHMGFSQETDIRNVGSAFEKYPLAVALFIADMEATYFVDDKR